MDFPLAHLRLAPSTLSLFDIRVRIIQEASSDIDAEKTRIRATARADRDALSSGLGVAAAAGVAARFMSTAALVAHTGVGTSISGYMPIGSEIDPQTLMAQLSARGSTLCLPDTNTPDAPLNFRRWNFGDDLRPGNYGIPVPAGDADDIRPDLLLVPMLAFDRGGHRLGYGGGYYDRTIAALGAEKTITTVGLAFSGQVRDDLPVGPHDMRLDWIVTESAALRVAG